MVRTVDPSAEIRAEQDTTTLILVIGVGGAGCNAVANMWEAGVEGVSYLACNTDRKSLDTSPVNHRICLGADGLGAGNRPARARDAAIASQEAIRLHIESSGCRMVFIAAGMGGGTGTGAAPVIARLAREMGILTVGVVTSPLVSEGRRRWQQAMEAIAEMERNVDALLVIDNDHVVELYDDLPLHETFGRADDVLSTATRGIAEIVTRESDLVGVDFADVSEVLRDCGRAHMSVASARGENRAREALRASLDSPLLDSGRIVGAKDILLYFTTPDPDELKTRELKLVLDEVQRQANRGREVDGLSDTNIIWGTSVNPALEPGTLELIVIATGFPAGGPESGAAELPGKRTEQEKQAGQEKEEPQAPEQAKERTARDGDGATSRSAGALPATDEQTAAGGKEPSAATDEQAADDEGQDGEWPDDEAADTERAPSARTTHGGSLWSSLARRLAGLLEGEDTPIE